MDYLYYNLPNLVIDGRSITAQTNSTHLSHGTVFRFYFPVLSIGASVLKMKNRSSICMRDLEENRKRGGVKWAGNRPGSEQLFAAGSEISSIITNS